MSTTESLFDRYGAAYKWWVTIAVTIGTFVMLLSATSITVAIPTITDQFAMAPVEAQWLVTAFLAAMTASMLALAWLVETFGERATFIGAMGVFIAASLLGGFAPNSEMLILARALQGATAGTIQPLAMIVIFRVFGANERGMGIGIYGFGALIGPAIGPVAGGLLVDLVSWRAVFLGLLPLCVAALVMGVLFLPRRVSRQSRDPFDWIGFALLVPAIVSLLWAFSNGKRLGWDSALILTLLGGALLASVGFVIRELRCAKPMLNLRVYRSPDFVYGSILSFVNGGVLFATTYLIPLFMQQVQGFSATDAGMVLLPAGLMMAVVFPFSGYLSDRLPVRVPTMASVLCLAGSLFLLMQADAGTSFGLLVFWILLGRLGLGVMNPPVVSGALRPLSGELLAHASGALSFARQLGSAFGVNVLAIILVQRTDFHAEKLARDTSSAQPGGGLAEAIHLEAQTAAFQDGFLILGLLLLATLVPAWMMGRGDSR